MAQPTTQDKLIEATLEALRTKGFAGASTRTIAGLAGVNPGLIFYYYGTLDDLLLAAMRRSSEERLERYGAAADEVSSLAELLALLSEIYREDVASGHVRVVSEMVAGSVSRPELAKQVMAQMEPWVELAERCVESALNGSPLLSLAPPRDLAMAAVTFYLGANLMSHLGSDSPAVEDLLAAGERVAPLLDLLGAQGKTKSDLS
jgi:AcrR family transcriptional regulator